MTSIAIWQWLYAFYRRTSERQHTPSSLETEKQSWLLKLLYHSLEWSKETLSRSTINHGHSTIWDIIASLFRSSLLRDQLIAGLRSTKLITVFSTECEEKSFKEMTLRSKRLKQISADVEDIIPEHPGWKVYLNEQQPSTRPNFHTKYYIRPHRKDDKVPQVHRNYVCIWLKVALRLQLSVTHAGKLITWLNHANQKLTWMNATWQVHRQKRAYHAAGEIHPAGLQHGKTEATSETCKEPTTIGRQKSLQRLDDIEDTNRHWPSVAEPVPCSQIKRNNGFRLTPAERVSTGGWIKTGSEA